MYDLDLDRMSRGQMWIMRIATISLSDTIYTDFVKVQNAKNSTMKITVKLKQEKTEIIPFDGKSSSLFADFFNVLRYFSEL